MLTRTTRVGTDLSSNMARTSLTAGASLSTGLARLPGVGPGLAQRILEERDRRGRFDSPEALRQVMGVGPKKLSALRALVTVGE